MSDSAAFVRGMLVSVTSEAVGTVVAIGDAVDVKVDSHTLRLSPAETKRRVRPIVSKEVAEAARASFKATITSNLEPYEYDRGNAYKKVLATNALPEIVATLLGIYGHPTPGYPETLYLEKLESQVFGELGTVLGVKAGNQESFAARR